MRTSGHVREGGMEGGRERKVEVTTELQISCNIQFRSDARYKALVNSNLPEETNELVH